ncbi:hypothetical protein GQ53DRAFT_755611 [Thozetella sp. PMI_491]|nr:hypothetical protein GQ53DRAFT_755611 [Thozetella sp. PMI_491]
MCLGTICVAAAFVGQAAFIDRRFATIAEATMLVLAMAPNICQNRASMWRVIPRLGRSGGVRQLLSRASQNRRLLVRTIQASWFFLGFGETTVEKRTDRNQTSNPVSLSFERDWRDNAAAAIVGHRLFA